jgi:hypothetical protein
MVVPAVGDVYRIQVTEVYPPKTKRCICIHPTGLWFFLINSENRDIYDCIPILKEKNNFLDYDSYISTNCTFEFDNELILKSNYLGRISENDIGAILNRVNNSKFLSQNQKTEIINSISYWKTNNTTP